MNEFEILMEKILSHFAGEGFKDELTRAKRQYFDSTVPNEENPELFDQRMSQFFDWYFFTRELDGYGQTPLEVCESIRELRFSMTEKNLIQQMRQHRHSLFQFIKLKGEDVYLKDLFANEKVVVKKSKQIFGFDPEEFFEARLIPTGDNYVFTRGFCFHPSSAQKFILSEIKRHKKDPDLNPEGFMLRLVKMRYKFEQYKHVKPEMIYTTNAKVGV
ncbi:MAG: hypothetical protein ACK5Y2_06275 [Bdellovibrionales bacterium]